MEHAHFWKRQTWKKYVFMLFILPAIIWVIAFAIYPFFYSIAISFTDKTLLSAQTNFVGFKNYIELFQDPKYWNSVSRSLIFTVTVVVFQFLFGFLLALLLSKKVRLTGAVRMSVMLPWVLPPIALALIWAWVLKAGNLGVVNSVLLALGADTVNWFGPDFALLSVIIISIWCGVPFSFMLELASLQKIPDQLYEAASVDGASAWQRLVHITMPMMKDTFRINLIMITIATIGSFDIIYAITDGGPAGLTEVMPLYMYHTAFKSQNMGRGSAVAVTMLLLALALTVVYLIIFRDKQKKLNFIKTEAIKDEQQD